MKRFTLLTLLLALLCQQGQAENWQYRLPDKTFLSVVSIPGSHDSATGSGWASLEAFGDLFARTQDLTIAEQWSLGVRAFDLRPCVYEDYLNINHGIMPTTLHFEDVMAQLRDSLIANPTEFVVIHMLHETDGDQVENAYNTRIQQVLQSDELKDYLVGFRRNLTVGDMRGKILILSRDKYASKPIGGFFQNWTGEANWAKQTQGKITGASTSSTYTANCYMQDYSDTHNAGGVDTKIEALTRLLDYSTTHKTSSVLSIVWVLNFMSAYSKVLSLFVTDVSKTVDGVKLLNNVSFIVGKEDKIAVIGKNELAVTMLFKILMGEEEPDSGTVKWGASIQPSYFPKDHNSYFDGFDGDLIEWMRQFSEDKRESYLRTFLGRMLFSGDDVYKPARVLSGGEKVRCMLSRMMLSGANFLVLDQPTNHLDLESIAALNNGLEAFKHNLLFACHDHQLTQTVANRILEITEDGVIDRRCSYDEYMHLTDGAGPNDR